jgi:CRP-like cAMP-binding protein
MEKNSLFIEKGKRNHEEYFILDGVCRSFVFTPEGDEITLSFFEKTSVLTPHVARTQNDQSLVNFDSCTPLLVGVFKAEDLLNLMIEDVEIRTFGNNVLQKELISKTRKEIENASLTARDRLIQFRQRHPLLENTVPHTQIASYLGITPISLSRLRKELAGQ